VGLERGPLSFANVTEELLEWKNSGSGSRIPRLLAVEIRCEELALISPTCGGRSAGIVCLRTKATEFSFGNIYFITMDFYMKMYLYL
jgi:hypothetical protein